MSGANGKRMWRAAKGGAPGSIMLMGEHAVLRGQPALVCAINRRLSAEVRPRGDAKVLLHSSLGDHETTLEELAGNDSFRFAMGAIRACREELGGGFEMEIRSGMSHQMGLGSSAAVTVAALAALRCAAGEDAPDAGRLLEDGLRIVRKVQGGVGSGADVAASAFGGCARYFAGTQETVKLPISPALTLLYSGYKTPTAEVIALVEERRGREGERALYDGLDALIGATVQRGFEAAAEGDLEGLGRAMDMNQGLMDAMGVNDARLSELVYALREDPGISGSKISGSGLGDCAVGLGRAMRRDFGAVMLDLEVDPVGATAEVMG